MLRELTIVNTGKAQIRLFVAILVGLLLPPILYAQERAPNGQIYGELKPFVGLEGVRFKVEGLGGGIWNTPRIVGRPEVNNDPETMFTGLSRAQNAKLADEIHADAIEALEKNGIPVLSFQNEVPETRPVLVVHIERYKMRQPDQFDTRVKLELLEAARLMKDPNRIVWASTWAVVGVGTASRKTLAEKLRLSARGYVNEFIRLYLRAHAH